MKRSGLRRVATCVAIAGLTVPSGALAAGPSAGDNQYVDPLAGATTPAHTSPPPSAPVSAPPAQPSAPVYAPASTAAAAPTPAPIAATAATVRTLPFTGLDTWGLLGIGGALLAAGAAVRRAATR